MDGWDFDGLIQEEFYIAFELIGQTNSESINKLCVAYSRHSVKHLTWLKHYLEVRTVTTTTAQVTKHLNFQVNYITFDA